MVHFSITIYHHLQKKTSKNSGSALVLAAFLIDQCGFTLSDAVQLLKTQRGLRGEVTAKATLVGLVDPSLEKQPINGSLKDVRRSCYLETIKN